MTTVLTRTVKVIKSSQLKNSGEKKSFSDYLSFANIILLGDPGAGKTHTFKAAARVEEVDFCTVPLVPLEQQEKIKVAVFDLTPPFQK